MVLKIIPILALLLGLCPLHPWAKDASIEEEEYEARNFLILLNRQTERDANRASLAEWAYASNLTEENLKNKVCASLMEG